MISVSRNVYIDKIDKYRNTYYRTIKMNPFDVKPSMYIDFHKESNKESPTFKVSDNVRISKYKNIFAKGYVSNWFREFLVIKKA